MPNSETFWLTSLVEKNPLNQYLIPAAYKESTVCGRKEPTTGVYVHRCTENCGFSIELWTLPCTSEFE
ncbi:unnamed protein product [Allacma fusca]|uniref:Uncharacterized protein n=1 Tax=Allacma fusca TaxID=39272 RepID=A0A8J2PKY0_9HEXA|nr:unnamed protein product [Allacma fusca]